MTEHEFVQLPGSGPRPNRLWLLIVAVPLSLLLASLFVDRWSTLASTDVTVDGVPVQLRIVHSHGDVSAVIHRGDGGQTRIRFADEQPNAVAAIEFDATTSTARFVYGDAQIEYDVRPH